MSKICLVVCWYGKLPSYIPVWLKSCSINDDFDFLFITENSFEFDKPRNVKCIYISEDKLFYRIKSRLSPKASLEAPYRLCDYRPMYGVLFEKELRDYDYWGYCDVDVVFGKIRDFLPIEDIYKQDAVFNGGHFTLIKNNQAMNELFQKPGALFDHKTVIEKDAIFAFDETTGIQRIARKSRNNCVFGVPYIDADSKYRQIRSRLDATNPDYQAYYWEKGDLYRVKSEMGKTYYQKLVYIHLQKRPLDILDEQVLMSETFWITPNGFKNKTHYGFPTIEEISKYNPFEGNDILKKQASEYKISKIKQIIRRKPFQIYVRLMQEKVGINGEDGVRKEMPWVEYKQ